MDEKNISKDRKELDRLHKNKKIVGAVGVILLFVGAGIVLLGALPLSIYTAMMDEDHITDDSLPIRDKDNATYTFEQSWINDKMDESRIWLLVGCIPVMTGYALMITTGAFTDDKKKHRMHCDGTGEKKYCPECGLKLSRLEKE